MGHTLHSAFVVGLDLKNTDLQFIRCPVVFLVCINSLEAGISSSKRQKLDLRLKLNYLNNFEFIKYHLSISVVFDLIRA